MLTMSDLPEIDFNSEEYLNQPLETLAKLASKIKVAEVKEVLKYLIMTCVGMLY